MCAAPPCLAATVTELELSSTSRISTYSPHQVNSRAGTSARMATSKLKLIGSAVLSVGLVSVIADDMVH